MQATTKLVVFFLINEKKKLRGGGGGVCCTQMYFFLNILSAYTSECGKRNSRAQRKTGKVKMRLNCWFSCGMYRACFPYFTSPLQVACRSLNLRW